MGYMPPAGGEIGVSPESVWTTSEVAIDVAVAADLVVVAVGHQR